MLGAVAGVGTLALNAISSVQLNRNNRTIIAKSISIIYRELDTLVENGDRILRILRQHNNGKNISLDSLGLLIQEQSVIIVRINETLRKRKVKTALSIHAPQLSPLQILLEGKSYRLDLIRDEMNPLRRREEPIPAKYLNERFGRVKLPSKLAIDKSRRELRKIKAQVEELRTFIVDNFQVHEVV